MHHLLIAALSFVTVFGYTIINVNPNAGPVDHLDHFWKRSFGSGHALLALRSDYQAQLKQLKDDLDVDYIRMHGIFDDDMSVYLGPGQYEFYNVDQIYDYMLSIGVRPIVELSFMPGLIANCSPWVSGAPACQYVMHYQGIVQPPANFSEWGNLCAEFAAHLVSRYGVDEVRQWHFEVWNELWGMPYPTQYLPLYDAAYRAIKSVDGQLRVGGPATMQCQFVGDFVRDTEGNFDFVSTHLYPTDPNCTVPGNAGYGDIDCFAHTIQDARRQAPDTKPFFLTEYNAGLFNPALLYSSYAAAFVFRNVPLLAGVLDVWSYWTFSDIFEENGMHSAPFEGFNYGIQTVRGVKKPVYRAFELLKGAGPTLISTQVASTAANETLSAFSTLDSTGKQLSVFLSNFAPEGYEIHTRNVTIAIIPDVIGCRQLMSLRFNMSVIQDATTFPYLAWEQMGSPRYPTEAQLEAMHIASQIAVTPNLILQRANGNCEYNFEVLPYTALRMDFRLH